MGPRRAKMAAAGRGGALDVAAAGLWLGLRDAARRCCRSALEGARRVSAAAPQGRLLPAASALGSGGDRGPEGTGGRRPPVRRRPGPPQGGLAAVGDALPGSSWVAEVVASRKGAESTPGFPHPSAAPPGCPEVAVV